VDSLQQALQFYSSSEQATRFVHSYMKPVISILLEQQASKIGQFERNCVEESLKLAILIVSEDLKLKPNADAGECEILEVLAMLFNRKKLYYKGAKPNWNANLTGLPEVRIQIINTFRSAKGFSVLANYLSARVATVHFPSLEILHQLLCAAHDVIPVSNTVMDGNKIKALEDDILRLCKSVMRFLGNTSEDALKKLSHDSLSGVRSDLQRIFDRLVPTRRKDTHDFYAFWRSLTLKFITSQSLPLRLFGWDQVGELIGACGEMRPPPRAFMASGAGCTFVNGQYNFTGSTTVDGYARRGVEISYERIVTNPEKSGASKKLTLFRCTMRSQQKWWFLSEADEEQPGTDKDIDYYQHKSKQHEEAEPPANGWVTCRNSGIEPPPTLRGIGLVVPTGEEFNTLEHQLAKWAIDNGIIELVLGDSVHREVVARSTPLIRFLASMCDNGETVDTALHRNTYCLQASHLQLAWKTCTSKADAAVSAEVYQLLVSILPSLPKDLATPLLTAIQKSLKDSTMKHDYLFEVAEFCSALATTNRPDVDVRSSTAKTGNRLPLLPDAIRAEILKLLWAVLTHPEASTLKVYDQLKSYVTFEVRVEPMGTLYRKDFLDSCKQALLSNAKRTTTTGEEKIDEVLALRMVKLTKFVLEACPHVQAVSLVTTDHDASLAVLLFGELTAFLSRRAESLHSPVIRRVSLTYFRHDTFQFCSMGCILFSHGYRLTNCFFTWLLFSVFFDKFICWTESGSCANRTFGDLTLRVRTDGSCRNDKPAT
jgi:hypothetical protein